LNATKGIIPVSSARRLSKESKSPCIVIFAIDPNGDKFTITTYGKTKPLCKHAASLGSQFAEAIFNRTVVPLEPDDLPDSPAQLYAAKMDTLDNSHQFRIRMLEEERRKNLEEVEKLKAYVVEIEAAQLESSKKLNAQLDAANKVNREQAQLLVVDEARIRMLESRIKTKNANRNGQRIGNSQRYGG